MKIAVLSGKGGTGKTLVSVNLAATARDSMYVDCDVEEPNGHLFFKPEDVKSRQVAVKIPRVDRDKCNGCRVCVDFCNFNALAWIGEELKIFDEICHSCGGCIVLCPQDALTEKEKVIGQVQRGKSEDVTVLTGMLNTGEASGIPIIKELLQDTGEKEQTFIDCPPGSACIVMETVAAADYCILVAEPTVFGVHNLNMVWELVKLMGKPCGVVINKCLEEENPAEKFCSEKGIEIIGTIPFDSELGLLNSNALIAARENDKYNKLFSDLLSRVVREVQS
ncbi:MAG: ATP-binding protein [Eubacteriales bacterium]|nr:ATP-binding protein [Eubacteriales bacterium]MDD4079692.1 ATP-binding protein [Eubacteriales bacterium]MDD4769529.1 ATP-binding protein [Eubacteriales bacterium]